jgi:hypothetical protein
MNGLTKTLCGTAILLAAPALALAQSSPQWLAVPPGFTAILVPAQVPVSAPVMMPDPQAMFQQMDAMMAEAEQQAAQAQAVMQTQLLALQNGAPAPAGMADGVVITTISDGTHVCTQRVSYPGNGGQPVVQLTSTANGCALDGIGTHAAATQARLPAATPKPAALPAGTLTVADRD